MQEHDTNSPLEFYTSFHDVCPPLLSKGQYETSIGIGHTLRVEWEAYRPYTYFIFAPSAGEENDTDIIRMDTHMLEYYATLQYEGVRGMRGVLLDSHEDGANCTVMRFGFALGVPEHELVLGAAYEAQVPKDLLLKSGNMQLEMNVFGTPQPFGCASFHDNGTTQIEFFVHQLDVPEQELIGKSYLLVSALQKLLPTAARVAAGSIWEDHDAEVSYTLHANNRLLDEFTHGV